MIVVNVRDDRMHVRADYEHRALCRSLPGARWNARGKTWHCPATPATALTVYETFKRLNCAWDDMALALLARGREGLEAQQAKHATELPDIPGRTAAWHHQRQAFHFAKALDGAMLAMDMGTGKSRTAIGLLEEWKAKRVLILCPRSVIAVWPKEFALHGSEEWTCIGPQLKGTAHAKAQRLATELARARPPVAVIINYESSWRPGIGDLLKQARWDVVVCDESHRIKSAGGRASLFATAMRSRTKRRLCLTGTPMPHSPLDIYAQYRFLDPGILGTSALRFRHRYAVMGGFEDRQVVAWQNQDELAEKVGRAAFFCKADDVLDLPDEQDLVREVELKPKALKVYAQLERDFVADVEGGLVVASNALARLLRLQQATSGYAVRADDEEKVQVGTEKQDLLADVLSDLKQDEPVVVFCRFHHDLDAIERVCEEQGRRYGELSGRRRDGLTDQATMSERVDVLGAQVQSGGVGIDLTRARYAVYYSLGFSLGDYMQSRARVRRPGQHRNVVYVHLVVSDTVDEYVYEALQARANVVEAVVSRAGRLRSGPDGRGDRA